YEGGKILPPGPELDRLDGRTDGDRWRLHVGDGRVRGFLERHRFPRGGIGNQLAQQLVVELVTGLVAAELADEAVAEKIEVTDRIEDLVLHELVLVAQAVFVEHAEVVEHDRVVEVAAEREIA